VTRLVPLVRVRGGSGDLPVLDITGYHPKRCAHTAVCNTSPVHLTLTPLLKLHHVDRVIYSFIIIIHNIYKYNFYIYLLNSNVFQFQ